MSRLFDGTDDVMVYNPGPALAESAAKTLLAVVKVVSGTSFDTFLQGQDSGSTLRAHMGRRSGGAMCWADAAALDDAGIDMTGTTTWYVIAITDAAGASIPRHHRVDVGGANATHAAQSTNAANSGTATSKWVIGGDNNTSFNNVIYAAAAVFSTVLSDADINGIATAATTNSIAALSPVALWDDSDAFATNLVNPGTYDRSSVTGTTDSGDDPPSWVYGLIAAPTPSQRFMWMP